MCERLSELRSAMESFSSSFDAALFSADDAERVVEHASAIEKMAGAVKAAAAARVAGTGAWKKAGSRSAAHHLARRTGSSPGQAQSELETARRLEKLPEAAAAARRGELSPAQAAAIAGAAGADPSAERRLVEQAGRSSLSDLRDECAPVRAAADPDLEARRERIHAKRSLRDWTDQEGGWHLQWSDNPEVGAAFRAALDPIRDQLFRQARAEGRREPPEAYAADAAAELVRRGAEAGPCSGGKPATGAEGADLGNAGHGATAGRESGSTAGADADDAATDGVCDDGVAGREDAAAPVRHDRGNQGAGGTTTPPAAQPGADRVVAPDRRRGSGRGGAPTKIIVRIDLEVLGMAHLGRRPTAAQQTALQWLYPRCANEACTALARLEYDHRHDWAASHVTVFDLLDRLCPHDHDLKTRENWSLVEGRGRRAFVSPDDPRHPRNAAAA